MSKYCKHCSTELNLSQFFLNKKTQKYASKCRPCNNAKRREYLARPEVKIAKSKHDAEYRILPENKKHMHDYHLQWYAQNREDKLRKNRINELHRLTNDPQFRMRKALRSRLKSALNGSTKSNNTLNLLGCNIEQYHTWIEYQFDTNMN